MKITLLIFFACVGGVVVLCEERAADKKGHWIHSLLNNIGRGPSENQKEVMPNERSAKGAPSKHHKLPPVLKPLLKPETKPSVVPETKPAVVPETKPEVVPETKPSIFPEVQEKVSVVRRSRRLNKEQLSALFGKPLSKPNKPQEKPAENKSELEQRSIGQQPDKYLPAIFGFKPKGRKSGAGQVESLGPLPLEEPFLPN